MNDDAVTDVRRERGPGTLPLYAQTCARLPGRYSTSVIAAVSDTSTIFGSAFSSVNAAVANVPVHGAGRIIGGAAGMPPWPPWWPSHLPEHSLSSSDDEAAQDASASRVIFAMRLRMGLSGCEILARRMAPRGFA